jgi:hypothetical protein
MFNPVRWLSNSSAWGEHAPLAMLLIDLARPRTFVELGTHSGVSYCAFCQAVQALSLPTRCFAVDTWEGDAHSREYPKEVYNRLNDYNEKTYATFSSLLKMNFDDALSQFENGSIDLLHIDGLHTYDAVKHDFESWKPKLSERGIVLFHDTAETKADFGVHRLWAELASQYLNFEFKHGHGLGILAVGSNIPPKFQDFLEDANSNSEVFRQAFIAISARDHLKPVIGTIISILHHQQQQVNRWKRQNGKEIRPGSDDVNLAMLYPARFARMASQEVLEMARELAGKSAASDEPRGQEQSR